MQLLNTIQNPRFTTNQIQLNQGQIEKCASNKFERNKGAFNSNERLIKQTVIQSAISNANTSFLLNQIQKGKTLCKIKH